MEKLKKTLGIITFYTNYNYGSSLQAYALSHYLENKGYETFIVDYVDLSNPINRKLRRRTYFNRILCGISHPQIIKEMLKGKRIANRSIERSDLIRKIYREFNENYLNVFSGDYLNFDAFICGSDQVWKLSAPGLHEIFFLRFTNNKKRISYAASLGVQEIPFYNRKKLKKYLRDFKAISVREDDAKILLEREIKTPVTQVLDPVLLVKSTFWDKVVSEKMIPEKPYIVCYFLDSFEEYLESILDIKERFDAELLLIDSGINLESEINEQFEVVQPTPFEFLGLIKKSKAIITDSFHGTAFSIVFHKNFWTIPRRYRVYSGQKSRLQSLFRLTKLNERYVENGKFVDGDINYEKVDKRINELRVRSEKFLEQSLEDI